MFPYLATSARTNALRASLSLLFVIIVLFVVRSRLAPESPVVLTVDVGGSHVAARPNETEQRRFDSGDYLTPTRTVEGVIASASGWSWDVVLDPDPR